MRFSVSFVTFTRVSCSSPLSMALLQQVCSLPLARAVQSRALTIPSGTVVSVPSPPRTPHVNSHVLIGMFEKELQQLAVDFGQQKAIEENSFIILSTRGRSKIRISVTCLWPSGMIFRKLGGRLGGQRSIRPSLQSAADATVKVGCPLRCSFCATGKGGYSRNLQRHEIIEQVLAIEEIFNKRVTNVVFMGMGEPMLNLKSVVDAQRCLNKDVQIGQRMITISTVGVPNTIKKLASYKLQSTLAVSLHAPNQKLRETIVPSAKAYPLEALMKDCKDYFLETSRRVSFEYTLLAGVNDQVEHAEELAELLHEWGGGYHVNLIPFNPIDGSEYRRPYKKVVLAFVNSLENRNITASVRQTRGLDASAACGQLRNEFQKSPLLQETNALQPQPEIAAAC